MSSTAPPPPSLQSTPSSSSQGADHGPGSSSRQAPESSPVLRPRATTDPLLVVCRCFGVVTAASAALCVVVNALSAVQCFHNGDDIFGGIFRCYAVVISLFVAIAETEWPFVFHIWKILEYWPGRGMLQIFVAVMTRAFPNVEKANLILLQEIASYLLLVCGLIYVISGVLCIGHLKRQRERIETTREQAIKDLQDLERRREELEALLLAERAA